MKRLPKLRPCGWDMIVVLAVLSAAALCAAVLWLGPAETEDLSVVILADSEEVYRGAPQAQSAQEQTLRIRGRDGYVLTVELGTEQGKSGVRVAAADCPTQDCVRTGVITRAGQSIVCLPARVVIRLEGGGGDVDLVSG